MKKLIKKYTGPYIIEEIILDNTIKFKLPVLMSIYPVVEQ